MFQDFLHISFDLLFFSGWLLASTFTVFTVFAALEGDREPFQEDWSLLKFASKILFPASRIVGKNVPT